MIQSGFSTAAFKYMFQTLKSDLRILQEEPKRSMLTLVYTALSFLPKNIYKGLRIFYELSEIA